MNPFFINLLFVDCFDKCHSVNKIKYNWSFFFRNLYFHLRFIQKEYIWKLINIFWLFELLTGTLGFIKKISYLFSKNLKTNFLEYFFIVYIKNLDFFLYYTNFYLLAFYRRFIKQYSTLITIKKNVGFSLNYLNKLFTTNKYFNKKDKLHFCFYTNLPGTGIIKSHFSFYFVHG